MGFATVKRKIPSVLYVLKLKPEVQIHFTHTLPRQIKEGKSKFISLNNIHTGAGRKSRVLLKSGFYRGHVPATFSLSPIDF